MRKSIILEQIILDFKNMMANIKNAIDSLKKKSQVKSLRKKHQKLKNVREKPGDIKNQHGNTNIYLIGVAERGNHQNKQYKTASQS